MAFMNWRDELNTGITVIDHQHQRIVVMINQLHEEQLAGQRAGIAEVLDDLIDYTLSHFTFEETLIEDAGYEFSRAHKRVHEVFTRRVSAYRERFHVGEQITDELLNTLSHWLFSHIQHDDHAYVDAVRRNLLHLSSDRSEGGWLGRAMRQFFRPSHRHL